MSSPFAASRFEIAPAMLGSAAFRQAYGVRYAYVAGAMAKGIASADWVIRLGRAGLLGFYGAAGQRLEVIEAALEKIRAQLAPGQPWGVNVIHNLVLPELEMQTIELLFRQGVQAIEAAAFIQITPALVWYRLKGVHQLPSGAIIVPHRLLGKASRLEVARQFLAPAPAALVAQLLASGHLSAQEAALAPHIPLADDLCAEADSAGHTDRRVALTLLPGFMRLRDQAHQQFGYHQPVRIGAAGGLGTPEAVAAVFMLGAEFVLTGSINQCTVEAGTSDLVKDLLAAAEEQDTEIAPAGDMFEIGGKVQVLKKGGLFAGRANKLYELYLRYDSLDQIDPDTQRIIQTKYFGRSFAEVWDETKNYYAKVNPAYVAAAEQNPKQKMAMIFRWYFVHSNRLALTGHAPDRLDYQIHCGPAMGAFNQWVRGTPYADWRARHVDTVAELLMQGAAQVFTKRIGDLLQNQQGFDHELSTHSG